MKLNLLWRMQTCNLIYNFLSVSICQNIGLFACYKMLLYISTIFIRLVSVHFQKYWPGGGGPFSNWNSSFKSNADLLQIKTSANSAVQIWKERNHCKIKFFYIMYTRASENRGFCQRDICALLRFEREKNHCM